MSTISLESKRRVKLYALNSSRQWDDRGTGHVSSCYHEPLDGMSLLVRSENDGSLLLESRIHLDTHYQRQQDTLIVWTERDNSDLALSFQGPEGCNEIWEKICQIQGKDPNCDQDQEDDQEQDIRLELIDCDRYKLHLILEQITAFSQTAKCRDLLASEFIEHKYIQKFLEIFRQAEEEHDSQTLYRLYRIFKQLFLYDRPTLTEVMLDEKFIMDVIGVFEYEPDAQDELNDEEERQNHRVKLDVIDDMEQQNSMSDSGEEPATSVHVDAETDEADISSGQANTNIGDEEEDRDRAQVSEQKQEQQQEHENENDNKMKNEDEKTEDINEQHKQENSIEVSETKENKMDEGKENEEVEPFGDLDSSTSPTDQTSSEQNNIQSDQFKDEGNVSDDLNTTFETNNEKSSIKTTDDSDIIEEDNIEENITDNDDNDDNNNKSTTDGQQPLDFSRHSRQSSIGAKPFVLRRKHRDFLENETSFKEVIPFGNQKLIDKIHQTYRVQYFQSSILPAPSILEENAYGSLTNILFFNKVEVVTMIQENREFLQTLFNQIISNETGVERKRDLVLFLKEYCIFSQTIQQTQRENLLKTLASMKILSAVEVALSCNDPITKSAAIDIFTYLVEFSPHMTREHAVQQKEGTIRAPNDVPDSNILKLVIEHITTDPDPELGTATQLSCILRLLLDADNIPGDELNKHTFLDFFYLTCMQSLVEPIKNSTTPNGDILSSANDRKTAQLLSIILDLVIYLIEHHYDHLRNYIESSDLLVRIISLIKSRHKLLVLSVVRFFRRLIATKDRGFLELIMNEDVFSPILKVLKNNNGRYNLVDSAILELFEFIRSSHLIQLLDHILTNFGPFIDSIDHVDTFKAMRQLHQSDLDMYDQIEVDEEDCEDVLEPQFKRKKTKLDE